MIIVRSLLHKIYENYNITIMCILINIRLSFQISASVQGRK